MADQGWIPTDRQFPMAGTLVEWLDPNDGHVVRGEVGNRLWVLESGVYVYYTPKFWRPRRAGG